MPGMGTEEDENFFERVLVIPRRGTDNLGHATKGVNRVGDKLRWHLGRGEYKIDQTGGNCTRRACHRIR